MHRKRAWRLWVPAVIAGILLLVSLVSSFIVASRLNKKLIRHRAFTVVSTVRTILRTNGPRGITLLPQALKILDDQGIMVVGILDASLQYRFLYPEDVNDEVRKTLQRIALESLSEKRTLPKRISINGKRAVVFTFVRPRRRFMRMVRMSVLEVVLSPRWPSWLRGWFALLAGGDILALILIGLFAWFLQRANEYSTNLLLEARKSEELRRLGELSAMVAHQLRNPLAGAKGNIQLGLERIESGRTPVGLEDIRVALKELERLEQLASWILRYTKEIKPQLKKTSISGLVALAQQKIEELQVDVIGGYEWQIDPELFLEVFTNLFENAVNAGASKVLIDLTRQGEIIVEDNGPGIPEDLMERALEPFVTSSPRGSGLGLALVNKIVRAHGGSILVRRSERLGGARFVILLGGDDEGRSPYSG